MDYGFIMLYRKFYEHPYWKQKRVFSMAEAWLDLIQLARFEKEPYMKILSTNKEVTIKRGEIHASIRFLSERWGWGLEKTVKFLNGCRKKGEIERRTEHHESILKLCNYDKYNSLPNTNPNIDPNSNRTSTRTNNNKDKERKKRKEGEEYVNDPDYEKFLLFKKWVADNAPSVAKMKEPFTFPQYKSIRTEYDYQFTQTILLDMHNWQDLLKKRVSANLTFRKWAVKNS